MKYRKEIDGLRAVAVLPVIFFHGGFSFFGGGFIGVDVFFVISGYLITLIIAADLDAGTFSIFHFYERRARRILPALFFVILLCLPFAWMFLLPNQMKAYCQSLVAVALFSSNVYFARSSNYFDSASELKPMLHTWSLALEEQFYILFPFFLMMAWRFFRPRVLWVVASISIISLFSIYMVAATASTSTFYLLPTRAWELMFGVFIGLYFRGKKELSSHNISEVLSSIGLVFILYSVLCFDSLTPYPSLYTLVPVIGSALIILYANPNTFTGKLLGSKLLVGLGLISFSAYLWHQPLFAFARHRSLNEPSTVYMAVLAAISILFGYFTWRYIERPFRVRGFISSRKVFVWSLTGSFFLILFGVIGHYNGGYEWRFNSDINKLLLSSVSRNPRQTECVTGGVNFRNPKESCIVGNQSRVIGAIIGDSHADTLSLPFSQSLSERGIGFRQMTYGGCAPSAEFFRAGDFRCSEYNSAVQEIIKDEKYKYIVIMARWTLYLENSFFDNGEGGVELNSNIYTDSGPQFTKNKRPLLIRRTAISDGYKKLIFDLLADGKIVLLVYPVPEVGWDVPSYAAKKYLYYRDGVVSTSYEGYIKRNANTIATLNEVGENKNLYRIYPENLLCNSFLQDRCIASLNGTSYYYDDNHLSNEGGKMVVKDLIKYINDY